MQSTIKGPLFSDDTSYFFAITTLESFASNFSRPGKPIRSPYYQIIWVCEGSGSCQIDLEKYQVMDNRIYIVPPCRFIHLFPWSVQAGFVVSFSKDFLKLAMEAAGRPFLEEIAADLKNVNMLSLQGESHSLQSLLGDMARENEMHLIFRREVLSALFKVFLIHMKRLTRMARQEHTSSRRIRLFNCFCSILEKNYKSKKQVAEYAREMSITPNYLTEVIRKVTGHSARYHIQQRMVQEAKRLALYNDANMKATAYALGFDDLSHFSKYFKMAAGMNFSQFKKQSLSGTSTN